MPQRRRRSSAAVEADDPGEVEVTVRRRQEGLQAAEAEADRDARAPRRCARAARRCAAAMSAWTSSARRLRRRAAAVEVLAALGDPGGAPEVVDRDRVMAGLGEALGQLDVEAVQAADVGQDDDAGVGAARRDSASAAANRLPSAAVSSSRRAPAPPAIGARRRSAGSSGGRASAEKHMRGLQRGGRTRRTLRLRVDPPRRDADDRPPMATIPDTSGDLGKALATDYFFLRDQFSDEEWTSSSPRAALRRQRGAARRSTTTGSAPRCPGP